MARLSMRLCQDNCILGIYHSNSWQSTKDRVLAQFKTNGVKRILIATTALCMGVNFPDVRYIVNWGPARSILDQHQEAGRAGRDGKKSFTCHNHLPWAASWTL